MAQKFEFIAEPREQLGSAHSRRLRRAEKVPAIVYGAGKEPRSLMVEHKNLFNLLGNEAVYSHILTLKVGNESEQVILKTVQRHHYKRQIMHLDFLRVDAAEKLTVRVPIHFINEEQRPNIEDGGVVSYHMTDLEIRCLPGNLPEFIEVDLANLTLDHPFHLSEIKLPKGVEFAAKEHLDEAHDHAVASVHIPREIPEEETVVEAAEGETAAEGAEGGTAETAATAEAPTATDANKKDKKDS